MKITSSGIAMEINKNFRPIRSTAKVNTNVPTMHPKNGNDTTIEPSDVESGPEASGVSSLTRSKKFGADQEHAAPYEAVRMLPVE